MGQRFDDGIEPGPPDPGIHGEQQRVNTGEGLLPQANGADEEKTAAHAAENQGTGGGSDE
ncbi:hypothetical protein PF007_g21701 [Phytophthora fragariae]|uniref:Uncharacterized protein n=1 Tax=Phytophthora fragariae TaxID=53985 RepID=A0A6A3QUY2_9STRA|nr:hypothetical protein PF003_g27364 [Phytophthora fragariae]KAE8929320.1 hypothetical protein PF009_g20561 [Phytophthora fragariae]KAE9083957.1 hypothetical protein PF007_g21701 [Phytophthora fragariae]